MNSKKVLIITYYWPPAGGPGVHRMLNLVNELSKLGWEPVILTVANGDYPAIDQSLISEIPKNVKVYSTKTIEPFSLFKKLTKQKKSISTNILNSKESKVNKIFFWIRANLFIPDARIGWKNYAVKKGKEIIKNEGINLILTTSPPQSVQLIGEELHKNTNLPWVADFRDPWTDAFWLKDLKKSNFSHKKDLKLEYKVLKNASTITVASSDFIPLFNSKVNRKYTEITNSFKEYLQNDSISYANDINNIKIFHGGTIAREQVPQKLLESIFLFNKKNSDKIEIHFYGSVDIELHNEIKKQSLENAAFIHGYINQKNLKLKMMEADVMLFLQQPYEKSLGNIPLKLFDYLSTQKLIIGIGNKDCRASEILSQAKCGSVFSYDESIDFEYIIENLKKFQPDKKELDKYKSSSMASQFVEIFNQLVK